MGLCPPRLLRLRRGPELLRPFAARKAFIYVLKIIAQVLPLIASARRLPRHWIAFIDN